MVGLAFYVRFFMHCSKLHICVHAIDVVSVFVDFLLDAGDHLYWKQRIKYRLRAEIRMIFFQDTASENFGAVFILYGLYCKTRRKKKKRPCRNIVQCRGAAGISTRHGFSNLFFFFTRIRRFYCDYISFSFARSRARFTYFFFRGYFRCFTGHRYSPRAN